MKVSIFFEVLIDTPKVTYKTSFFLAYLAQTPIKGVTSWEGHYSSLMSKNSLYLGGLKGTKADLYRDEVPTVSCLEGVTQLL